MDLNYMLEENVLFGRIVERLDKNIYKACIFKAINYRTVDEKTVFVRIQDTEQLACGYSFYFNNPVNNDFNMLEIDVKSENI